MNSQENNSNSRHAGSEASSSYQPQKVNRVINRRQMVRGAAAAVPAILSLRSGAALARSSNLISTVTDVPDGEQGVYHCLDTSSATQVGNNVYDLGEGGDFVNIPGDKTFYDEAGNAVSPADMCQTGGTYYAEAAEAGQTLEGKGPTQPDFVRQSFIPTAAGSEPINVPQGGLVSATAFASILGRANINIRNI
jgi:hypothetical protein